MKLLSFPCGTRPSNTLTSVGMCMGPTINTLPCPFLRLTPTTAHVRSCSRCSPWCRRWSSSEPIRCREPYPPPRATAPRTAPATASLRHLRCRPRPPRSAPTRPPSCAALGRRPRWVAATEAGTASTGTATEARTASTSGGLGVGLGGLDGRPRCSVGEQHGAPRRQPPHGARALAATSMRQVLSPPAPTTWATHLRGASWYSPRCLTEMS
jgi:hypothetical protein